MDVEGGWFGFSHLFVTLEDVGRVFGIPYAGANLPTEVPEEEMKIIAKRVLGIPYAGAILPTEVPEEEMKTIAKYRNISLKCLTSAIISEESSLHFRMSV